MLIRDKLLNCCNKAIYWEIIAIPFVASFSSAAVNVFIGLLIFTFIIKKLLNKKIDIAGSPLNISFAILIIISLTSFVNSVNIHSSIQGIVKLLKYGSLLIILESEIKDRTHIKKIIIAAMFGLLLASLDGLYQLVFGVDFFRHKPYDYVIGLTRLKAAFPHTNIFAGYLTLFVPVSVALFLYYLKGKNKAVFGVIFGLGLFCLIFTFCRSAAIGFFLTMLLAGLLRKDKLVIFSLVALIMISPFIVPKNIRNWSQKTGSITELLLNKERLVLYETSFNMIKHHPVLGVGVNTYCLNYQKYKLHDTGEGTANTMWYAHNSYLQMASEIGIIGLLVFFYLLFQLFKQWWIFYKKAGDNFLKISSLGLLMGIVAFLVHGLTETNLYYPKIVVLFWFHVSLLTSILFLKKGRDQ